MEDMDYFPNFEIAKYLDGFLFSVREPVRKVGKV